MSYSMQDLVTQAREAGATAGTATERVTSALDNACMSGFKSYDCQEVTAMRAAYVAASKAAAASDAPSQARAKAAAHNMFSRSWDALVAEGKATARPSKGKGRNAGKATKKATVAAANDADNPETVREITEADVPADVAKAIGEKAIAALLAKHGLADKLQDLEDNVEAFRDALKAIGDASKAKDDAARGRALKAATEYVKDAGHCFASVGKALTKTLEAAGVKPRKVKVKPATATATAAQATA